MIRLTWLMTSIVENTKNAIVEFKLRFLLRLSTKSRFQTLYGWGNESRRGWNQEIREGRCLNRSIGLISNSNAFKIGRTCLFIGYLGITVWSKWSTVMMERSIVDCFKNVADVGSQMEHPDEPFEMRYKTHEIAPLGSRSDGRDALPARFMRAVITPSFRAHAWSWSGGPRVHSIDTPW